MEQTALQSILSSLFSSLTNMRPPVENLNKPLPIENYNKPPVENYNRPPVENYNPPVENLNGRLLPVIGSPVPTIPGSITENLNGGVGRQTGSPAPIVIPGPTENLNAGRPGLDAIQQFFSNRPTRPIINPNIDTTGPKVTELNGNPQMWIPAPIGNPISTGIGPVSDIGRPRPALDEDIQSRMSRIFRDINFGSLISR